MCGHGSLGKKLGGTAITSEPGLKEQQITYIYGKSQPIVRTTDNMIPIFFPISLFFFGFHKLCINTSVNTTKTTINTTAIALA